MITRQSLAKPKPGAALAPSHRNFRMRDLWRLTLWGLSATAALTLVAYASTSELGRGRAHVAVAEIHEILIPSGANQIRPLDAQEGRRLAETVRALTADRERLLARVATLEQSLDGITGSIARVEKAVKTPPETIAAPVEPPSAPGTPGNEVTSSVSPPANIPAQVPMPPQPPPSNVSKTEFGLDLGSASTVESLRTAWAAALRRHGLLLEGLHAVVQTRERARPGAVELRLIAGPIPNAATAARLCAAMTAAGAICAPALFEGQRLAGR
jgi:hypothetical protein